MKKRVLSLVLTVAMIATLIPVAAFAADDTTTFPDMPNDWSTEALQNAIDNGLLNGIDGKIAASENLTRAQMAAIVTRAFGTNGSASLASFGDVNSGDWYYDAMAASVKMGAFKGDGNKLNPNVAITRQEAFTVLARLFTLTGADQSVLNGYTDGAKVADWAKDSMASMVKAGYVSGSDNMLNPTSNITRAEFAKVMDNLLKDYLAAGATEGKVTGNAILNKAGTLENVTVSGDLIVGDGAAEGDVALKNVTVNGRLVVRGGGVNTVKLEGTTKVGSVVINKATGDVRLNNTTSTAVNVVVVSASATLTGKYDVVTLNTADTMLTAADATIATVNMNNEDTGLQLTGKSTVTTVNVNEDAKGAAVNVAKNSTITTVNSKADGVKMAGEGKITKANVSGNNNAVNTVGTTLVVSSGVTGTTSNGNDIKGGTTVTTAATGSKPTTGGSTDSDWGWGDSTTTVEVDSDSTLATAINEGKANIINVKAGTDLSAATVSATRTSSTSLTINFGDVKIANLSIEALNVTNITLNGDSAETQITGTLTINAPKAHVVNNIKTGTADIKAASKNSYVANKAHTSIKLSGGARVVLADAAKAATISVETAEPVILAGTMDGKITVSTANADATIAGTAKEVEVTGTGANLTVAKGAETAGNVTVKSAANVTVESGAKAAAVEVTSEGASASVTVAGEATKVTVGAAATVSLESGAKVPAVEVTGASAQVSIDTTGVAVEVKSGATGVVIEATAEAEKVAVKSAEAVTVYAASEGQIDKDTTTANNITVEESVKVTFDANGGEVTPAYMMVKKTSGAVESGKLPTATRTGYTSKGWFAAQEGGEAITEIKNLEADTTYYAQWKANTYTVKFDKNGASGDETMQDQTFEYDEAQNLTENAYTNAGYTFAGWNTVSDGTGTSYADKVSVKNLVTGAEGDKEITLYAQWTDNRKPSTAAVTALTAAQYKGFEGWKGIPAKPEDVMTLNYGTATENTFTPTGTLKLVTNFTGFNTKVDAQQNGYYAGFVIPYPADKANITGTDKDAVITLNGKGGDKTVTLSEMKADTDAGMYVIFHVADADATTAADKKATFVVDWDGSGAAYSATTYTVDFSKVTLERVYASYETRKAGPNGSVESYDYPEVYKAAGLTIDKPYTITIDEAKLKAYFSGNETKESAKLLCNLTATNNFIWYGYLMGDKPEGAVKFAFGDSYTEAKAAAVNTISDPKWSVDGENIILYAKVGTVADKNAETFVPTAGVTESNEDSDTFIIWYGEDGTTVVGVSVYHSVTLEVIPAPQA